MSQYTAPLRDMNFVLNEIANQPVVGHLEAIGAWGSDKCLRWRDPRRCRHCGHAA